MTRGTLSASVALGVVASISLGACRGGDDSAPSAAASGALGVVTAEGASRAVAGLCEMAATGRAAADADAETANSIFFDRVHQELHVIVAAIEDEDPGAAAVLQQDKFVVEDDVTRDPLPRSFVRDVERLVESARNALRVAGIDVPACGG